MKKRTKWGLLVLGVVLLSPVLRHTPYLLPTTVALGPCAMDWSSPSSYPYVYGVSERASPLETVDFSVGEADVRVCFGSPAARGRTVFGTTEGLVRYGQYWRTGANEPARIFVNAALEVGDFTLPAGRYAIFTRPDSAAWEVFFTTSTFHWGYDFSASVVDQVVGQVTVPAEPTAAFVEQFAFWAEPQGQGATQLVMAWADRQVKVPLRQP